MDSFSLFHGKSVRNKRLVIVLSVSRTPNQMKEQAGAFVMLCVQKALVCFIFSISSHWKVVGVKVILKKDISLRSSKAVASPAQIMNAGSITYNIINDLPLLSLM